MSLSDANDKIERQAKEIESIASSQYEINKLPNIIKWGTLIGIALWLIAIISLFQRKFTNSAILILLGFVIDYPVYRYKKKLLHKKLDSLAKDWGVKRHLIPNSTNLASVVTNKVDGKTYSVSTVEYKEFGFWEVAVAEHKLPFSDFTHALYTTKTESQHDAIVEHVRVEYIVKNMSPKKWNDIMLDRIKELAVP